MQVALFQDPLELIWLLKSVKLSTFTQQQQQLQQQQQQKQQANNSNTINIPLVTLNFHVITDFVEIM